MVWEGYSEKPIVAIGDIKFSTVVAIYAYVVQNTTRYDFGAHFLHRFVKLIQQTPPPPF